MTKNIKSTLFALLLLIVLTGSKAFAQDIEIKGRIIDLSTNQGFAGARISVVNTRLTAMSEDGGAFEIKVPESSVTFSVEAPGYQTQIVALKGRNTIEISMLRKTESSSFFDNSELSSKGSVSVSDFSINALSIDEDISSRLNGEIRGISHSGSPASGSSLFSRGYHSLLTSSQPLYVVDGIVWQIYEDAESILEGFFINPLAAIDPNDVEKVRVLKSGSSIYGSKGANGVILIDTKRSRSQATDISVNLGFGYRSPFNTTSVMNAEEYRIYASDIIGGKYDNTTAVEKYKFLDDDATKSYYRANHNRTDWLDRINKGAISQNYGISVKGGDDIALYAVSIGYTNSEGNVENTGFERLNFRANSDIRLTKALNVNFDIAFSQTAADVSDEGINEISSPVYVAMIKSPLYHPYQFDVNGNVSKRLSNYDELGVGNPLALTENGIGKSKQYALNTSILPSYTFMDDKLKLSLLFSYGWKKLNENSFTPDNGIPEYSLYNDLGEIYAVARNKVQDRMDSHTSIIVDGRIDWKAMQDENHLLNAFGGYRFYTDTYKSRYASGYNTGSDNMTQLSNTAEGLRFSDGIHDNWKSMSWYANAEYSYRSRYLLNLSAAMDASSRFGEEADGAIKAGGLSWGIFPSVSAGWVISSENFMKSVDVVNFLKLTANYSISGNDNLPNYATRSYFSSVSYWAGATGLILENIGNPELKWETTNVASVGLDFSMFNNRWSVKTEFYSSKTKDLLVQKQLNEVAGLKTYWTNDGKMENKGFEASTTIRALNLRDFKLDLGTSIGKYKNEITSLGNGSFITDISGAQILSREGQPAGVFYGYKTKGVFSTKEEAANANLSIRSTSGALIPFEAGDMYFEEVVKDGIIDENDKQIIGDPNPDFYGSFTLNASWKKFTLSSLFTYSYGNDVYNALRANLESGKNTNNQSTAMQNRWVANGQITDIPRATYDDPMGNARFSDRWIEDGSYLKLKSVSLTYTLPLQLTFLQEISIWGSVSNIFTLTKYLGSDPEFSYGNSVLYQGIDAGLTPSSRTFNLGVKINL